jgi:hypothetical protein
MGRRPIRMTVQKRSDDPAVQHPRKSLVVRVRMKLRHDTSVGVNETADA